MEDGRARSAEKLGDCWEDHAADFGRNCQYSDMLEGRRALRGGTFPVHGVLVVL